MRELNQKEMENVAGGGVISNMLGGHTGNIIKMLIGHTKAMLSVLGSHGSGSSNGSVSPHGGENTTSKY